MKKLGWFKLFFLIIFPVIIVAISFVSFLKGYHAEAAETLAVASAIEAVIWFVVFLNRNTK